MKIAIQARLEGLGIVNWATETGCAPRYINMEQLMFQERNQVVHVDLDGPIYNYKRDTPRMRWELSAIDARRDSEITDKEISPGD